MIFSIMGRLFFIPSKARDPYIFENHGASRAMAFLTE